MDKFIVVGKQEAIEKGYPEYALEGGECVWWDEHHQVLFETDGKKPLRVVGRDHMEPEDVRFTRDLAWVPEELNKLARERDALRDYAVALLMQHRLCTTVQAEDTVDLEVRFSTR